MKLDTVLTIAIGRNDADDKPLSDRRWRDFTDGLRRVVGSHATIVFMGHGDARMSDGDNLGNVEESYCIVAINPPREFDLYLLRYNVAILLRAFGQTSACAAVDTAHEPVWNTADGYRRKAPQPVSSAAYAPSHGGYCV